MLKLLKILVKTLVTLFFASDEDETFCDSWITEFGIEQVQGLGEVFFITVHRTTYVRNKNVLTKNI
jgi:hypothetical protein